MINEESNDEVVKARESLRARLAARWQVLRVRQGVTDFDVATWAREVRDIFSGSRAARVGFWRELGINPKSDGKRHLNMAKALDAVPSVSVWRALGGYCAEMCRVASIQDSRARTVACKRIVDAHEQIRVTAKPAAVPEETKLAIKPILDSAAPKQERAKAKADSKGAEPNFAKFAKRLGGLFVSGATFLPHVDHGTLGLAFVLDLLSAEERKAAGLPAKGKKAKAS